MFIRMQLTFIGVEINDDEIDVFILQISKKNKRNSKLKIDEKLDEYQQTVLVVGERITEVMVWILLMFKYKM